MRREEYEAAIQSVIRGNAVGAGRLAPMSNDLPPPSTKRWVVRRKAAVVTAVRSGRISLEEALQRYQLTEEEYQSWERAFDQHGLPGLRSTRLQQYRTPRPRRGPRSRH